MLFLLFFGLTLASAVDFNSSLKKVETIENSEEVFLNRILSFQERNESTLVKDQIRQFFIQFPKSIHLESLHRILGDILFQEKRYLDALSHYDAIGNQDLQKTLFSNYVDCLYHLKHFSELFSKIEHRHAENQLWTFYLAESLLNGKKEFQKAAFHYEMLLKSPFQQEAKKALISVYKELKNFKAAAEYCVELSQNQTEELKTTLLFEAALLQLEYDDEEALKTFNQLQKINSSFNREVALHRINLFLKLKKYEELIQAEMEFKSYLAYEDQKKLLLNLAHAHLALKNYQTALKKLNALSDENSTLAKMKLTCGYHLKDVKIIKESLSLLEKKLSKGDIEPVLLYAARAYKNLGASQEAKMIYEKLAEEDDNVWYEYILFLYDQRYWKDTQHQCELFLKNYTTSVFSPSITLISFQSLLNQLNLPLENKENLVALLKQNHFSLLQLLTKSDLKTQFLCHYFLAQSSKYDENIDVVFHVEKALEIDPKGKERPQLFLIKFHALAKKANATKEEKDYEMAAESIFQLYEEYPHLLQKENYSWLANFYFHKIASSDEFLVDNPNIDLVKTTLKLYERAYPDIKIEEESEKDFYNMSWLYSWLDNKLKQLEILQLLYHYYEVHPEFNHLKKSQVLTSMGIALESYGDHFTSKHLYELVLNLKPTSALLYNKYRYACLLYEEFFVNHYSDIHPSFKQMVKLFKEIKNRKKVISEPLHLNAGLKYAKILSRIKPNESLAIYKNLHEEFTVSRDIASKDYFEELKHNNEKMAAYTYHITLIEKEIKSLE